MKEDNGRDSPAEYSEPVDGGAEVVLKLRLSSSFADTKLTVYSKDTIGQCKKKLQVSDFNHSLKTRGCLFKKNRNFYFIYLSICFSFYFRHKKMLMHVVNVGFTVENYLAIKF